MSAPRSGQQRAKWMSLSILYVVLFTFPFVEIFNRTTSVLGVPLLILYLLLAWFLFILAMYRFSRRLGGDEKAASDEAGGGRS